MIRKRAKRQGLRTHRSYTVDDAAKALAICKATVRRWIKTGRLKPIDDLRPTMLAGSDLIAVATKTDQPKRRCKANEVFCLRCRDIRPMASNEAKIIAANASGANLRAVCATCSTLMHKRVSLCALPDLARELTLSAPLALQHLVNTEASSLSVNLRTQEPALSNLSVEGVVQSLAHAPAKPVGSSVSIANTVPPNPSCSQSKGAGNGTSQPEK